MQWTKEQQEAIQTRGSNLLVSAAAGSGKTALLIERIRRIIVEERVEVNQLLVLTFTRAAAAEMKERLTQALMAEFEKDNVDTAFVLRQINALPTASISTLHAFCNTIVRDYFQEGGVDPEFTLGDATELAIIKQEAMDALFEKEYQKIPESGDTPFSRLIDAYTDSRNDNKLKALVETYYDFLVTQPDPEKWCDDALNRLSIDEEDFFDSPLGQAYRQAAITNLEGAIDCYRKGIDLCQGVDGFLKIENQLQTEYMAVCQTTDALSDNWENYNACFAAITFPRFATCKGDKDLKDEIKALRDDAKKAIKAVEKLLPEPLTLGLKHLSSMAESMTALTNLTFDFDLIYRQFKQDRGLLDFNDLERMTLNILKNPTIAQELREKYVYIFLDEYQDTNDMQEAIIQKILRKDNYFMVGDVKQSIYRFRLADPTIFIEKYHRFASDKTLNKLVLLNRNFRSRRGVIRAVNQVFGQIMSEELGEIDYDDDAMLYDGLQLAEDGAKCSILLMDTDKQNDLPTMLDQMSETELEARMIGREIQNRVGSIFDDSKTGERRVLRYRDIGVLMRSVAGRGEIFAQVFSEMGIPAYFDGESRYYATVEMTLMMNLLTLIDNRRQDLPLLAVMLSPIGGFSTDECAVIRLYHQEGTFYAAAESYAEYQEDALASRLSDFYNQIAQWRYDSEIMDIEDFLWKVYRESGYYTFASALPNGEQRQRNLRVLLKRAADFKKSTMHGLFGFIRFVERMKKHRADMSPPGILSDNEDVVRITTIHKSKGLEFPIVFTAGLGRKFNMRGNSGDVCFHKQLGICPQYIDLNVRAKMTTVASALYQERVRIETLSEEMRLLYVAMTRAREELILTATFKDQDKAAARWQLPPTPYSLKKAACFADWVMPAVLNGREFPKNVDRLDTDNFNICLFKRENLLDTNPESAKKDSVVIHSMNDELFQEIDRRLSFKYPYVEPPLPGKMTVTEMRQIRKASQPDVPDRVALPKFMEEGSTDYTPAQRGTAIHTLLQHLNLESVASVKDTNLMEVLEQARKQLVEKEIMESALAATIDLNQVENFLNSDVGQRLLKAKIVCREMPFNYRYDPARLDVSLDGGDLIIQGMIDCFFEEDGAWVLLDYKSDHCYNANERAAIIHRYGPQIDLYAEALSALTNKSVKAKYLCLLSVGEMIEI